MREEKEAEVLEKLIRLMFDRLPGCHEKPSEEVVTHHLDELWHLRPGGTKRKIKKKRIRKGTFLFLHVHTSNTQKSCL